MSVQFAELSASPDIIVATPGRLLHHLSEIPGFNLKNTRHVVLDEADRLFEMGLGSQVRTSPLASCSSCYGVYPWGDGSNHAHAGRGSVGCTWQADTATPPQLQQTYLAVTRVEQLAVDVVIYNTKSAELHHLA